MQIRKKRGPKKDPCDTTENIVKKIKDAHGIIPPEQWGHLMKPPEFFVVVSIFLK